MNMLKAFWPLFLLTKSLHYYFHFTWYQYSTGLFLGNIVFLLTVILLSLLTHVSCMVTQVEWVKFSHGLHGSKYVLCGSYLLHGLHGSNILLHGSNFFACIKNFLHGSNNFCLDQFLSLSLKKILSSTFTIISQLLIKSTQQMHETIIQTYYSSMADVKL